MQKILKIYYQINWQGNIIFEVRQYVLSPTSIFSIYDQVRKQDSTEQNDFSKTATEDYFENQWRKNLLESHIIK